MISTYGMKYLKNLRNFEGKIALVRSSLNVEDIKNSLRLEKSLDTLNFLKKGGAKIIIIGHRGRPHGHVSKDFTLLHLMPFFKKNLTRSIHFFDHFNPRAIRAKVKKSKNGSVFLLENIRFNIGEEKNDKTFAHQLAGLGDFYVNDDFSTSHREHASIAAITKHLPGFAGLALEKEIEELDGVMKRPKKPLVVILAGGKAFDKFSVVEHLYDKAGKFLIGGVIANTILVAKGEDVANSVVDHKLLPSLKEKHLRMRKLILPSDFIKEKNKILDIGPKSQGEFARHIKGAGTVIWAGPMGFFENPLYRGGSEAVAKAIAKSNAYSIIGGGETSSLIVDMKLENKVNFLSTGGGAMLAYLAGKPMPGITALEKR
ncbi:MAG: phosphoglycerate kinase [bacterium]|nr:phosphoglycerate kinase [bacterium]